MSGAGVVRAFVQPTAIACRSVCRVEWKRHRYDSCIAWSSERTVACRRPTIASVLADRPILLATYHRLHSHLNAPDRTRQLALFGRYSRPTYYLNTKNCSLSIVSTATDQKPQKALKRWYYPPSHRLNANVMLSNITFLMIFFCGFWSIAVNIIDKLQF